MNPQPVTNRTKLWGSYVFLLCLVTCMYGCQSPAYTPTGITGRSGHVDVLMAADRGIYHMVALWLPEIDRRYPDEDLIIIDCHGATGPDGTWWLYPDIGRPIPVTEAVANIRRDDSVTRIVILACNPDGIWLPKDMLNVTYALKATWVVPDYVEGPVNNMIRDTLYGDGVGTIAEFVEQ